MASVQIQNIPAVLHLHCAGVRDGSTGFVAWLVAIAVRFELPIAQKVGLSVEVHIAVGVYGKSTKLALSIHPDVQVHEEC